ncbi:glucans biosynthesis glucosyltransferase H [Agaricicola taiwanensis]|uniref:Glucans biosynthesis glucosyltransferase H n=1 Tax=Agaricicola taiwanensis TaxID=591372 RepID=A0A8J2VWR9_9RHOB|nr:glucans biosynthesis glucosyltransferase H [Agaricicola taiwanensis]
MDSVIEHTKPAGADFAPALPADAPLDMPVQSLWRKPQRRAVETRPAGLFLRRLIVIGGAAVMTYFAAQEMFLVLNVAGLTLLESLVLGLYVALFAWIAFSFISSCAGFVSLVLRNGKGLGIDPAAPLPELATSTAILLPVYNEAPARIMAGLQSIYESIKSTGRLDHFHFFILSDTTDADAWIAEEAAYLALRERTGGHGRIFYRRRPKNTERKAGNISDWVRRFGGAYPQMLVLDADSVMSGDTIVRMASGMERHPGVGLIQTLPIIVNGSSLFARMQQFAGRIYGPMIAHGIAWWHGSEGNYWGHNAIIRTEAFAAQAGLPHLGGRKPFGGHILSHDFIEAALMRRAGWAIHMIPALSGSYEESPPSLTDLAIRDRRWCQGNLQHAAVLPARGLHWVSRLHLLTGIGSYITAPLWLIFILTGIAISLQAQFVRPEYFTSEFSLFPVWPAQDAERAIWVFVLTMSVLFIPKILAWLALLTRGADRRGSGGMIRSFVSMVLESVLAGLLAPVTMLTQSMAVVSILTGRDSGWNPQRRDDGSLPFREVLHRYGPHTLFGLLLAAGAYAVSVSLFLWMSPVLIGLVLAIPLAMLTSSRSLGLSLRKLGLLRIPEEYATPEELRRANELYRQLAPLEDVPTEAMEHLAADSSLRDAHRRMLPPPRSMGERPIDADLLVGLVKMEEAASIEAAVKDLTPREKAAVLGDHRGLERLAALAR